MIKASIDIGSNTVLLLVAKVDGNSVETVLGEQRVTRLGKGVEASGELAIDSMKDTRDALDSYLNILESSFSISKEEIIITATEAARVAKNSSDFFQELQRDFGIKISIISGEEEAYYSALGVTSGSVEHGEFVVVDIGGASTEFIRVKQNPFQIVFSVSIPIGSVRATEWLKQDIFTLKVDSLLDQDLLLRFKGLPVIGVAGTYTSLSAMSMGITEFSTEIVHGSKLTASAIENLSNKILKRSVKELQESYPHLGKRAEVIRAGSMIASSIVSRLELSAISISCRGLRYGTIIER